MQYQISDARAAAIGTGGNWADPTSPLDNFTSQEVGEFIGTSTLGPYGFQTSTQQAYVCASFSYGVIPPGGAQMPIAPGGVQPGNALPAITSADDGADQNSASNQIYIPWRNIGSSTPGPLYWVVGWENEGHSTAKTAILGPFLRGLGDCSTVSELEAFYVKCFLPNLTAAQQASEWQAFMSRMNFTDAQIAALGQMLQSLLSAIYSYTYNGMWPSIASGPQGSIVNLNAQAAAEQAQAQTTTAETTGLQQLLAEEQLIQQQIQGLQSK